MQYFMIRDIDRFDFSVRRNRVIAISDNKEMAERYVKQLKEYGHGDHFEITLCTRLNINKARKYVDCMLVEFNGLLYPKTLVKNSAKEKQRKIKAIKYTKKDLREIFGTDNEHVNALLPCLDEELEKVNNGNFLMTKMFK